MTKTIENGIFRVILSEDGTFELLDKTSGHAWLPDPWGAGAGILSFYGLEDAGGKGAIRLPSHTGEWDVDETTEQAAITDWALSQSDRIIMEADGTRADIVFQDDGMQLRLALQLQADTLALHILDVKLPGDVHLQELQYPLRFAHIPTYAEGYTVIPHQSGMLIPTHQYGRIGGEWWRMDDAFFVSSRWGNRFQMFGGLFMNWYGMQHEDRGLMCIIDTPFDAAVDYLANTHAQQYEIMSGKMIMKPRINACTPVWLASNGGLGYPRQCSIRPIGKEGYVEMCRRYRAWSDTRGWTRTLDEKIAKNPDIKKLAGSTHIDIYGGYPHYVNPACDQIVFTFAQIRDLLEKFQAECGLKQLSVGIWGCFENNPPECWPVHAARGGSKGWRSCCDKAKALGYLISAYHAYSPNMENGTCFHPERSYKPTPWTSNPFALPRWSRLCSSYFKEYVERNQTLEQKHCGPNANFTDILGVYAGTECHARNHPHHTGMTRRQDYENRRKVLEYLHSDLGLVTSTEHGSTYLLRDVDAFHGVMRHVLQDICVPVPLLQMCFHDCVITRSHPGLTYRNKGLNQFPEQVLLDLSFGNAPLHCIQIWEYEGRKGDFMMLDRVLGRVHGRTAMERIIRHDFLDDNFLVRRTEFSGGTVIHTNHGLNPWDGEVRLPAYGYHITFADGTRLSGRVTCRLDINPPS